MKVRLDQITPGFHIGDIVECGDEQYAIKDLLNEEVVLEALTPEERIKPEYLHSRIRL